MSQQTESQSPVQGKVPTLDDDGGPEQANEQEQLYTESGGQRQHSEEMQSMKMIAADSPLKSAIRANSSYKVREFEWFEVETKIRLFVQKLMEPTLKQIYEDRRVVDDVQTRMEKNGNELEYLRDVVLNQGSGIPIFEEFNGRIFQMELKVEQERRKNASELTRLETDLERMRFESKQLSEQCRQIELTKVTLLEEFGALKRDNLEFRDNVTGTIQNLQAELTANFSWVRQQMQRFEEKFSQLDVTLFDHLSQLQNGEKKTQELRSTALEFAQKHHQHEAKFEKVDASLVTLNEQIQLAKRLQSLVQSLQNKIDTLDSYISTYQPLYIQGQISESLFNCLPQNMVNKLAVFESNKFEEFHKNILNDEGQGKVAQKIQEYSNFMELITKRTSKLMQTQRVKNTIGNDEDTLKEEKRGGGGGRDSSQSLEQSEASEMESKSQSNVTFQAGSIENVVQGKPKKKKQGNMSAAESQQYEDLIQQMKSQIKEESKEFKSRVELTVRDVYSQIKEMDEQLFMQNMQNQEEAERRTTQTASQIQELRDIIEQWMGSQKSVEDGINKAVAMVSHYQVVLHSILSSLVLITQLLVQDEIDRQGIALMGLKENTNDEVPTMTASLLPNIHQKNNFQYSQNKTSGTINNNNNNVNQTANQLVNQQMQTTVNSKVIQLQQNCLSCSAHPLVTVTAFKMACLAYNPSDITIDGKALKRDKLLEMCSMAISNARKELLEMSTMTYEKQNEAKQQMSKGSSRKLNYSMDSGSKPRASPLTNLQFQNPTNNPAQATNLTSSPSNKNSNAFNLGVKSTKMNMINLNEQSMLQKNSFKSKKQKFAPGSKRNNSTLYDANSNNSFV